MPDLVDKTGWSVENLQLGRTFPKWVSGRYYQGSLMTNLTTATTHEQMFAVPVYVPGAVISELGLEITAACGEVGSLARVGIYDDFEGIPWDLLLDAGTIPVDAIGWQHCDTDIFLFGWNWLAIAFNDYTGSPSYPIYRAINHSLACLGYDKPEGTTVISGHQNNLARSAVQAGLPPRFQMTVASSGTAYPIVETVPRLMVKAA